MKMTKNGVTTTKRAGSEQYQTFRYLNRTKHTTVILFQYDYRYTWGELFSCVGKSLEDCRSQRDAHALKVAEVNNW